MALKKIKGELILKKVNKLVVIYFAFIMLFCTISCSNPVIGNTNPFVGTWKATTGNRLEFKSDFKVASNWMGTGTYSVDGNSATLKFGAASRKITISGNSFTFSGVKFTKLD